MEPWNDKSLRPPPVHTVISSKKIDLEDLKNTVDNIIHILSHQHPLHKEGAIFSRLIYKYDKKFRNDIGFRNFKKVKTALRKYLELNFIKDVQNFLSVLPREDDDYLPTRQMLEYILVRLMTFSKIMLRCTLCSKQTAIFYLSKIKRGEAYWMSVMPYTLLSRVWSLSTVLVDHSCKWYTKLYNFIPLLKKQGMDFLPENYVLPNDLAEFLDMKNVEEYVRFDWALQKKIVFDTSLAEDEDADEVTFNNILNFVSQINEKDILTEGTTDSSGDKVGSKDEIVSSKVELKAPSSKPLNNNVFAANVDQGQVISRETLQPITTKKIVQSTNKPIQKEIYCHSPGNVTNLYSLKEFISNEEKIRNESKNAALTSHLSFMQWQALKNSLLQLCNNLCKNRKIEKKFKKIWKEKCMDYT